MIRSSLRSLAPVVGMALEQDFAVEILLDHAVRTGPDGDAVDVVLRRIAAERDAGSDGPFASAIGRSVPPFSLRNLLSTTLNGIAVRTAAIAAFGAAR